MADLSGTPVGRCRRGAGATGSIWSPRRLTAILTGVVAIAVISGCASPSAKEKLIESTNKKCDSINQRFTGDLAYGKSIGGDDLEKMRERIALIKDLQKHVREQPALESGRDDLDAWLDKLDAYADDTDTMHNDFTNAQPGSDLVLAMSMSIVQDAALATKAPAKRFGLDSCTHVEQWEKLA